MKKYLSLTLLVFMILSSSQALAESLTGPFRDVPLTHWAVQYIQFLKDNNIASGYPDGTFKPERSITRAEISKMAMTSAQLKLKNQEGSFAPGYDEIYADVPFTHSLNPYIAIATSRGLLETTQNFYPEQPANRFFTLKLLIDSLGLASEVERYRSQSASKEFSDVFTADELAYTGYAKQKGIIQGYGDGRYGPNDVVRRSEMAKIIRNTIAIFDAEKGVLKGSLHVTGTCGTDPNYEIKRPFRFRVYDKNENIITDTDLTLDGLFFVELPPGSYTLTEEVFGVTLPTTTYVMTMNKLIEVDLEGRIKLPPPIGSVCQPLPLTA